MALAFQLKAAVTAFRIGRIPTEADSTELETLAAALNDLSRHANYVGAIPSAEISAGNGAEIAELVARIDQGPFGVSFDPALTVVAGGSPAETYRTLYESVNQIIVRDAVRDMDGMVQEVPVGRGEVAWDELLGLTAEAEFRDWFVVRRTQGEDKTGDITRAIQFVQNVFPQ